MSCQSTPGLEYHTKHKRVRQISSSFQYNLSYTNFPQDTFPPQYKF
ncbi:unnamed protein product, partial [Staurois parvus]